MSEKNEWKPIESAPKDGSRVLIWHPDYCAPITAQWYGSEGWKLDSDISPFWMQPTHWMPLPPLPAPFSVWREDDDEAGAWGRKSRSVYTEKQMQEYVRAHAGAFRSALASAPVAGDAQPVAYLHTSNRTLTWPGKLTEVQLNSGVWRPLYDRPSAPQASEAVHGQRGGDVEAVLRLFLTGDGFIAECDIPHIVAALAAQPAINGYTCTVPDDCETLHWRGQILSMNELASMAQPAASDEHLIETGCYQTVIDRHSQPAASAEPSDTNILAEWAFIPNSGDMRVDLVAFARALLSRHGRPAGDAQPAVWVAADTLNSPHPTCISSLAYMSQRDRDRGREYVPLYAAPVAAQAPSGPEGWVMVPVQPTEVMKAAGCRALGAIYGHYGAEQCWKAMLDAAMQRTSGGDHA